MNKTEIDKKLVQIANTFCNEDFINTKTKNFFGDNSCTV